MVLVKEACWEILGGNEEAGMGVNASEIQTSGSDSCTSQVIAETDFMMLKMALDGSDDFSLAPAGGLDTGDQSVCNRLFKVLFG